MIRHIQTSLLSCLLTALPLALACGAAAADTIYKCVDVSGVVTYTNQKSAAKNCTVLSREQNISSFPAPPQTRQPSPGSFPRVDGTTQKGRDDDRRKILEDELATEQKLLDESKKQLDEAQANPEVYQKSEVVNGKKVTQTFRNVAKYDEKVKPLQDAVDMHQRNIEALQTEISNLK